MHQSVKTKRTFFTEEKHAAFRKNINSVEWAKKRAQQVLEDAAFYYDHGVEKLLTYLAPQEIARSYTVNQTYGCPNCGHGMKRYSDYGWKIDFIEHPWKVQCPNCGNLYPSNDFGSFYESGLDEHGLFSYDRADKSLLVNELYPDKPADYAVDDGKGWISDPADPENSNFTFIPMYVCLGVWNQNPNNPPIDERSVTGHFGLKAIKSFAEAYLITGDKKYGYAGAALFYRFALLYPTMDVSVYPWEKGYKQSHGLSGLGRFCGSIWDTENMRMVVEWYDMLFDCFDDTFAAYLRENPARYIGEIPKNGIEIRNRIEETFLMQIFDDGKNYILNCNVGPMHSLFLKTALILERPDVFDDAAEFLFQYIDHVRMTQTRMDLESLLLTEIDRDGFAGEASASYNNLWTRGLSEVADLLRGHKYDLFCNVKFNKLGRMIYQYVSADKNTLSIADYGKTGNPGISGLTTPQIVFFMENRDPKIAQVLVQRCADGPICTDWFMDCAAVDTLIRETAYNAGPFHSESRCLSGYGLAAVESHPEGKDPEATAVYFGHNYGHGHRDSLTLHVYGFGINLMPDLGYPNYADLNAERFRWTSNFIAHNTVTLRQNAPFLCEKRVKQYTNIHQTSDGGKISHYYTDGALSVIEVDAANMFRKDLVDFLRDEYRRTVVTVDLDGKSRYIVDLFASGAKEQYLSYHAFGTETETVGAVFTAQSGGTYAGEEIPYADDTYTAQWADGFNYLTDVRRSASPAPFTVDWKCMDNWHVWEKERDVHVKIHMISSLTEASLCTGTPPQAKPGNPKALTYLIAKCDGGPAKYVSVIEPYENESFIEQSTLLRQDEEVTVVLAAFKNGRRDYIVVNRGQSPVSLVCFGRTVTVTGFLHLLSFAPDGTLAAHKVYGEKVLSGTVCDFTRELSADNFVTVQLDSCVDAHALAGRFIDIDTVYEPNAFYEIKAAESLGDGIWKLSVGDCTFIRGFIDRDEKEKGYTYFIEKSGKCKITL